MAFTLNQTSGAVLAEVADGTVNTTACSITLIGKNYPGYGTFFNENIIRLLENFANTTAPTAPLSGQIWFDSANKQVKFYTDGAWKSVSSSTSSSTAPSNPSVGDQWWDTTSNQLKVFSGSQWITIGPAFTASAGTSGAIVETIQDTSAGSHVVVKFFVANTVIAIVSRDSEFTPQTQISGFTTLKPGINLISPSTLSGSQFTGTASNAASLNGVQANQLLRSDIDTSTDYEITAGGGFVAGSDFEIKSQSGFASLTNLTLNNDIRLNVNRGGTPEDVLQITGSNGTVTTSRALSVGTNLTVSGTATVTGNSTHTGTTTFGNTLVPASAGTINIGEIANQFADVYAETFHGTAVEAQYADLAERYHSDRAYPAGTLLELGGENEVTSCEDENSTNVFGVVSTRPGLTLNAVAGNNDTHPYVALVGRVPVRVIGPVAKGDRLVPAGAGCAKKAGDDIVAGTVVGRALENKDSDNEGLVEAVVRISL